MNFLLSLIPAPYRLGVELALIAIVTLTLAVGFAWFCHYERNLGRAEIQAKWDAERVALERAVQDQRARNLDLQRQAEEHYVVQAETREKTITKIITEVRDATVSLAACPVPEPARRLLNDAASCAREDRPAACGAGDAVQSAQ